MKTETIELIGGYTAVDPKTKKETIHREVVFGKRLTAQDLMNIDVNPQAIIDTNYQDLMRRQMITKFGTLKMPVVLTALSSLDSIDRDDLESAADRFLVATRDERTSEIRENNAVKLMFGFEINETNYNVVEFGNRITGLDFIEADTLSLRGIARDCFLIGKQISKLSNDNGSAFINGQVGLDKFNSLDGEDLHLLKVGAELFRQMFRYKREAVQEQRDGSNDSDISAGNETIGSGNNGDADGAN